MEATTSSAANLNPQHKLLPKSEEKVREELSRLVHLPSLSSRMLKMNEEKLPPVEGFVVWLKYVVKNLFRVPELNKVLTGMQVRSLSRYGKGDKMEFILYHLDSDARCYESMPNYDVFTERIALAKQHKPGNRLFRDGQIILPEIHPGLVVKLIYWETVMHSGFRYDYHNQMFQDNIIGAMKPLSENDYKPKTTGPTTIGPPAPTVGRMTLVPSSESPLKLRIKKENLHSENQAFKQASDDLRAGSLLPMQYQNCTIIDCVCGRNVDNGEPMFQCTGCGIWQHKRCILGTSDLNDIVSNSKIFKLCFQCRIKMADPFYSANQQFKFPYNVSFTTAFTKQQYGRPNSSSRLKEFRRAFTISEKVFRLLWDKKNKLYLGLACLLVQDKVQNRINLPKNADVHVNGRNIKMYNRCSSKELSDNGRDMLTDISQYMVIGENLISMTTRDTRNFVLSVQIYEEKPLEEVKKYIRNIETPIHSSQSKLLLKQKIREKQALFKVRGDELGFESIMVSLICPFGGSRMKYPVKAAVCRHAKFFDGETFLQINYKSKKWQCPHCMKAILVTDLELDLFMVHVLERLKCHADVNNIEINREGKWRPFRKKVKREKEHWFSVEEEFDPKLEYLIPESAHVIDEGKGTAEEGGLANPDKKDPENGDHAAPDASLANDGNESESESEELDEAEELRRAIAASGIKRKPKPPPEVIDLISSDEEEEAPRLPAGNQQQRGFQTIFPPLSEVQSLPVAPRAFKRLRTQRTVPQTGNPLYDISRNSAHGLLENLNNSGPSQVHRSSYQNPNAHAHPADAAVARAAATVQSIQDLFNQGGNVWSSFAASATPPPRQSNQEEVIELD